MPQPLIQGYQIDPSVFGSPQGSGGVSFTAGNGLTLSGSPATLNIVGAPGRIVVTGSPDHIDLAFTTVTPGSYTSTNLTVDAYGRITAAASGSGGGGGGNVSLQPNGGLVFVGSPQLLAVDEPNVDHDTLLNFVANEHIDHTSVTLTAGAGLTGGGDISASRSFVVGAGTGITVNADDVALDTTSTRNTDHASVSVTAGAGLTGGGAITSTVTLDVGAGTGITVNINDVALDTLSTRNTDHTAVTLTAGAGLTGGGDISASRSFAVGAGDGITVNADDVAVNSTVVRTSGSQTIGGLKDFTTNPTINGATNWHSANDGAGSGLDADLLDGLNASEAATGSTIVQRHASGYIFGTYLNQSSGQNENPTIGQFFVENSGADGYLRKASIAAVQSALGITGGAGTVTSVGISGTNITVGGTNPVTTSGTITISIPQAVGTSSNVQFGGVGVGTAPAAGEVRATGNITAFFSDMRLKDVVRPIDNALAKVCTLDGFIFKVNDKAIELGFSGDRDQLYTGVSAQQVQQVLPEVIREAPLSAEYMTLDYSKMVPLLIEAIKDLKKEIDELKRGR